MYLLFGIYCLITGVLFDASTPILGLRTYDLNFDSLLKAVNFILLINSTILHSLWCFNENWTKTNIHKSVLR